MEKADNGNDMFDSGAIEGKIIAGVGERRKYIIYPDEKLRQFWDLVMTV
jgi:hypothetical protein